RTKSPTPRPLPPMRRPTAGPAHPPPPREGTASSPRSRGANLALREGGIPEISHDEVHGPLVPGQLSHSVELLAPSGRPSAPPSIRRRRPADSGEDLPARGSPRVVARHEAS